MCGAHARAWVTVSDSQSLFTAPNPQVYVLGRHVQAERRASLTLSRLRALQKAVCQEEAPQKEVLSGQTQLPQLPTAPQPQPQLAALLQYVSAEPLPPAQNPHASDTQADGGAAPASSSTSAAGSHSIMYGCLNQGILEAVALELSVRTGLTMFNFDVVVPVSVVDEQFEGCEGGVEGIEAGGASQEEGRVPLTSAAPTLSPAEEMVFDTTVHRDGLMLYVVDINYFPGYDKLEGWETHLVAHLSAAADLLSVSSSTQQIDE